MTSLIEFATSWKSLLLVVLVFGFAPGFVLRLIVLLYPSEDLRRQELVAELYAMARVWRPVWVAQQIETALFEGPVSRARARRARKVSTQEDSSVPAAARKFVQPPLGLSIFVVLLAVDVVVVFVNRDIGVAVVGMTILFVVLAAVASRFPKRNARRPYRSSRKKYRP